MGHFLIFFFFFFHFFLGRFVFFVFFPAILANLQQIWYNQQSPALGLEQLEGRERVLRAGGSQCAGRATRTAGTGQGEREGSSVDGQTDGRMEALSLRPPDTSQELPGRARAVLGVRFV